MAKPFFFIMGRPRSGTTLLKTLFDAHPNVKIPSELPIFLPLYQKFKGVKNWDEKNITLFIDHIFKPDVFNNRRIENLKIDRERFTEELLNPGQISSIQDLLIKFNEHAYSPFDKKEILLVGDKNPVYSIYTKRFIKIFPEARFICIVRDYRDNFVSLRNLQEMKLEAPLLTLQIARWVHITRLFHRCAARYPERFCIVRYEDLVQQPEKTFESLCGFLNIPYSPGVFNFHMKKDEILNTFQNPAIEIIHKSLMSPVNTGRMNLWKEQMTAAEIQVADQIAGSTADLMHYERAGKSWYFSIFMRSIPMWLYCKLLFTMMTVGSRLPYRMSRSIALNLPGLVRFYSKLRGKGKTGNQPKQ
ncbi:MAG TPA: hypothetical protein DEO70_12700 [Bacteroidales bacterium]|nr:hypothetical protein [Bacteroidales bacterium]